MDKRILGAARGLIAGYIAGAVLLALGAIFRSVLLFRMAFVLIAIGLGSGAFLRLFAFGISRVLRSYAVISVGGRLIASLILLYWAFRA